MNSYLDKQLAVQAAADARGYGPWRRGRCPYCVQRVGSAGRGASFAVHQVGFCMCFRCGVRLWLPGADREGAFEPQAPVPVPEGGFEPPEGFVALDDEATADLGDVLDASAYLRRRKVSTVAQRALGIGTCIVGKHAGRIVVPALAADNATWLGWSARLWAREATDETPKYLYPPDMDRQHLIWNLAACSARSAEPLLICEGVFDALPYWPHAVALLGKPSAGQFDTLVEARRPIVVCLDGDAWEEGRTLAWQLSLDADRDDVRWLKLPPKQDPGTVDPRWLVSEARAALRAPLTF